MTSRAWQGAPVLQSVCYTRGVSQTRLSQLGVAAVVLLVLGLASSRAAPPRPAPPDPETVRALFDELVREEPGARARARDDWAHHRWSQQDAFGAFEHERAAQLARDKKRSEQDLLLVIDHGLRAHWPGPDGQPLEVTTVPLKPRAMD